MKSMQSDQNMPHRVCDLTASIGAEPTCIAQNRQVTPNLKSIPIGILLSVLRIRNFDRWKVKKFIFLFKKFDFSCKKLDVGKVIVNDCYWM